MIKAKTEKKTSPKPAPKVAPKKVEAAKVAPRVETPKKEAPKSVVTAPVKKGEKVVNPATGGVGRRKSSVARVWLTRGNGMTVNGLTVQEYFQTSDARIDAVKPLKVCAAEGKFKIQAEVNGGGLQSQAGAVRLGIARALLKHDESFRIVLRENGLLTVDSRIKERKKPGQKAARRKFQFVKR